VKQFPLKESILVIKNGMQSSKKIVQMINIPKFRKVIIQEGRHECSANEMPTRAKRR